MFFLASTKTGTTVAAAPRQGTKQLNPSPLPIQKKREGKEVVVTSEPPIQEKKKERKKAEKEEEKGKKSDQD